jgi:transcriptional regulator with XRE-family HTH domain
MSDTDDLAPGSLVRRWRLGKRLREIRESSGKTMDDAAAYLGVRRPTISRIENGRHAILPKNVKFLCQLYETGAPEVDMLVRQAEESNERGWWASYSDTMPDWFETYIGFEADVSEIWTYESELVPGLLQVPSYVRAMRTAYQAGVSELEIAKSVAFRLERQKRLEVKPPVYRVVLNEAVVRRPVGDMAKQLQHLVDMSQNDYLDLRILPFAAGPHPGMTSPFSVMTLPDEPAPNFVYLEHEDGAIYLERPVDLAQYANTFEKLVAAALSPISSREFLANLVEQAWVKQEGPRDGHGQDEVAQEQLQRRKQRELR